MNPEEAKSILHAYRPDGSDASDATICAALKVAKDDPVLAKWFERQQAFDRAMCAKLSTIEPPAALREAILAGASAGAVVRAVWWQQPRWLAMAAGVLVLLSAGLFFWPNRAEANAPFMAFVANDARHSETHGGAGEPTGELQARLTQPTTRLGDGLPVNFDTLRNTGCRAVSFQGHDVLEVCFKRDGKWFHCYIVRQADFPTLDALAKPAITELEHLQVATWSDSAHVYLVVSKVGLDALQHLL
jgi:hypothetical protein